MVHNIDLQSLKNDVKLNKKVWLLLYKQGSQQSDCAFENFTKAENLVKKHSGDTTKDVLFCSSDVNIVKDIHPEYNISSVPVLIQFEDGLFKNMIKGCHKPEQFNAILERPVFSGTGESDKGKQMNVTVYTTPMCTWCNTIKRHFKEHGVQYREVDVSRDTKAAGEMVKRSGQQGVPQTDINGQIIVGFDRIRINKLLGIN
ncbi:MAG: glutaredoxin domain-containing protein [Prolixibacteraceae bacterium]|jgi:glutaredoxin-like YruB-family protein|nr:glutaredoxin domain-containing protein [Prolixibacteraceae bacterium]MDD4754635.1 glutaredoxin domain-containing protein [Prolixibacteraceae bacterium]